MNQAHPPDSQRTHVVDSAPETNHAPVSIYERDPTYYFPDGNIVFLASGILFKVYAFLVLPIDSILSTTGNTGQRYPLGVDDLPERLTDSNDINPIALPNITAVQFRSYLLALLGRIHDLEYYLLFIGAKSKERHTRDLLVRLLDMADVSRQFGMNELREWAILQLELVLESRYELAKQSWDKDTLLRLHSCARFDGRSGFVSSTVNFIQYFISIWTVPEDTIRGTVYALSNLDTCVQLFKDPKLLNNDPALFGCAFISVLALGHRSEVWTSKVSRGQRAVLYAAQVQLTAPNEELESSEWLVAEYPLQLVVWICETCCAEFSNIWATSFRKYSDTKSTSPLIALAQLPQFRRLFSAGLGPGFSLSGHPTGEMNYDVSRFMNNEADKEAYSAPHRLPLNLHGDTRRRDRIRCQELEWPLGYLDYHIQLVYQELAERYKDITSATVLAEKGKKSIVGDGASTGFVVAVLAGVPSAYKAPYGWLVFAQNGPTVQRRSSDILPGDVIVMTDIKLKGHRGLQGYSAQMNGELVGIVGEFEVKKHKLKVWQPALQPSPYPTIESVSYRMEDLKSGTIQVYRVAEDV